MADTLAALDGRVVVWAHAAHVGDARAITPQRLSLGALVRDESLLIGLTTHRGSVTAASEWGGPGESRELRPALPGSWEERFQATGEARGARRLERSAGVVYTPADERMAHYLHARLGDQFDAVLHVDETTALEPLAGAGELAHELPRTYPFGL
jgi:erythromycin esterase-like protein